MIVSEQNMAIIYSVTAHRGVKVGGESVGSPSADAYKHKSAVSRRTENGGKY